MCTSQLKLNEGKTEDTLSSTPSLPSSECLLPLSVSVDTHNTAFSKPETWGSSFTLIHDEETHRSNQSLLNRVLWLKTHEKMQQKALAITFALARLDYYNFPLKGTTSSITQPTQKVQNSAARNILRATHH